MQRSLCCPAQPYIVLWVGQDMFYCTNPLNHILDDPAMDNDDNDDESSTAAVTTHTIAEQARLNIGKEAKD